MIRLENVTKTYKGDVVALRDVSADIQKGEFVFLVGPSGSGKSTFSRLLLKEEEPSGGRIWAVSKDIAHLTPWKTTSPFWMSALTSQCDDIALVGLGDVLE